MNLNVHTAHNQSITMAPMQVTSVKPDYVYEIPNILIIKINFAVTGLQVGRSKVEK